MNSSRPFWLAIPGRVAAFVFLVVLLPTLLFIGLLIGVTAGGPVLLADSVTTGDGAVVPSHRFRTTGPGAPLFHAVGRWLRRYGFDGYPALWSVVRGDIGVGEDLRFVRRR
jgi:lipopolysaccharide/colanic/teichoic acid biosynthesis glycosyltransferase